MIRVRRSIFVPLLLATALLAACGGGGGSGSGGVPVGEPEPPQPSPGPGDPGDPGDPGCSSGTSYDGTFDAIQQIVFERHGCTQDACHGSARSGGLELTPAVAYQNLFDVDATATALKRVHPGDNDRSFLWLKLAAATNPGSVQIAGSPMPLASQPLSADELELVRLWIYGGAPATGTVSGTEELTGGGCLPPLEPITIKPLDPPAAATGIQLVMPQWRLEAGSEHEICFASYFDISEQVPEEYRDPSGQFFRFRGQELRQDPQSHHLILNYSTVPVDQIHDPAFGEWTCKGGERDGEPCEPTDTASCGSGLCATPFKDGFACIGFGPGGGGFGRSAFSIGGAQQAQASEDYPSGVFAQIPMKGILYWNSHAFNLTSQDHVMNARLNYYFADDQRYPVRGIFNTSRIFSANAAPFTEQLLCHDQELPQGAHLFNLSSHTHARGKHFTVDLRDGTRIYDSFVYNDPLDADFAPALVFDSADPADRVLHYCSLYNNGVSPDGSPDIETVTRYSRLPQSVFQPGVPGRCSPKACVAGKVGAPCNGVDDDAACDSSPGAGDGWCDACAITGGESTENEMFILIGSFYIPTTGTAPDGTDAIAANGRSTFSEIALPPIKSCMSSHGGGHAGHAGHSGH
jgi:hypothetical protein